MGSDSAATYGADGRFTIGQQFIEKAHKVNDNLLFSTTGAIGMSQLIGDKLKELWNKKQLGGGSTPEAVMDIIGKSFVNMIGPYLQTAQIQRTLVGDASSSLCKSLVGITVSDQPCLFQFDYNGAPERCTDQLPFVSLGSGQQIADPFLAFLRRLLWESELATLAEGRLAAIWTISHVLKSNPYALGIGGEIQITTLGKNSSSRYTVAQLSRDDIQEHLQKILAAENALVNEAKGVSTATPANPPAPPAQ